MLKKYPIYVVSFSLLFFVSLPLFLLSYKEESYLSVLLVVLYLAIQKVLDVVIRLGNTFKWSSITIIITGFFGVKNLFFVGFLILLWRSGYLESNISAILVASYYCIYSIVLIRKMLQSNYVKD